MPVTVLDLVAYLGLAALGAFILNLLLGVLMAFRYSPVRYWPHRRFNYFALHKFCGYSGLVLAAAHVLLLLFNSKPRFRPVDLIYPVHSPQQPLENSLGAMALYLLVIVVLTSFFRIELGRRLWKAFHFAVYGLAVALFWHALMTDPELHGAGIDLLDGGKVFVELSAALAVVLSLLRWRRSRQKRMAHPPAKAAASGTPTA
jgi:predicted ferric reductase